MFIPDHLVAGQSESTVFLFHGAFGSKDYWRYQIKRFVDRGYRVVAWDAPGYGISALPEPFTLNVLAEAAARLIDKVGSSNNAIIGHSMGGQISPRICRELPGRVQALVISATIGWFGNKSPEEQAEFVGQRSGPRMSDADMATSSRALVTTMFGPDSIGPEVELVKEVVAQTPQTAFRASIEAIRTSSDNDSLDAIQRLRIPTMLVAGEVDGTGKPDGMKRLADRIQGSEFHVLPGVGHYGWAERPDLFNPLVFGFLEKHMPR